LNLYPPNLCFLSNWDYRHEPLCLISQWFFLKYQCPGLLPQINKIRISM
jgi:hypothetical protein